ncbi:ABC transporter permease [Streptomyces sp. NBC_00820]|uniref:ABC transporter permease n=1 Tax=Streptomyces sp. NBC_00820 TaxID=2975842 RepID=UPI002ED4BB53|nr:ABC transporter permease [Streptomyces sp. NBC_00820]
MNTVSDSVPAAARALRCGAVNGLADLRAIHTWWSWTFGWLARMVCQVLFFAVSATVLGPGADAKFLVVGNAVAVCAIEAMMVVASSAWERRSGTLPLLVAGPANPVWVLSGRGVQWLLSGTATSFVAFCLLLSPFGVRLSARTALAALPLIACASVSTYCFGLFVATVVLGFPSLRNVAANASFLVMMAICGVEVPQDFWPWPVRAVADVLPLTHELGAVRRLLSGASADAVAGPAALGLVVGAGWLALAVLAVHRLVERGRRDGSIEFTS